MARRHAAGVRGYWSRARPGAVDQTRSLAQRGKPQAVWIFLPPFEARFFSVDPQAQIVLVSSRDLAGPEHTASAFRKTQHDLNVVVEAAAGHEGMKLGSQLPAIEAGHKTGKIESVSADVSQRTRRPALCGIRPPDSLLLTGLFQRRRQPSLRIFDMDQTNRPQLALGHHLASLPHQGIAGVVVSHGKEKAGTAHSLGKVESVVKRGGQRFVANNVDAGFEKCLGGSVVQMVWRHD